jgi:uncharacterized protein
LPLPSDHPIPARADRSECSGRSIRNRFLANNSRDYPLFVYLPIAEIPVNVFTLLALAAAVGFVAGMFGVGGGFLMTPLLVFLGIPPAVAVATGAAHITASSMTGALGAWRRKALDLELGGVLIVGGIIGTLIGVMMFNAMRRAGIFEIVLVLSYVSLLGAVGGMMLFDTLKVMLRGRAIPAVPAKQDSAQLINSLPLKRRFKRAGVEVSLVSLALLGVFIGIAGSILGIGGGFLVVPALIYFFRIPTAIVVGTSLLQILFTMAVATMLHAVTNQSVDIVLAMILTVGGVIGAQFGARTGGTLKGEHFRLLLAILIFGVAVRFALEIGIRPQELFSVDSIEGRP